jgi:hypothetical protein
MDLNANMNEVKNKASSGFGGLFAQKKVAQQEDAIDLGSVMRDVTRRLRVMEERMATDRKNIQINQQNTLGANKKLNVELKSTDLEINELKKEINSIKEQMVLVVNELKETTKKEDVKTLEKYIELWEPLNFVTQREVESLIRRILNEK